MVKMRQRNEAEKGKGPMDRSRSQLLWVWAVRLASAFGRCELVGQTKYGCVDDVGDVDGGPGQDERSGQDRNMPERGTLSAGPWRDSMRHVGGRR